MISGGLRRALDSAALVIVLAACSSGGQAATPTAPLAQSSEPAATVAVTPAPTPAPTGPATATLTFVGDPHLAAGTTGLYIRCNFPNVIGPVISIFGTAADGVDAFYLALTTSTFDIRVSAGSGKTFTSRTFHGLEVTGFDPARGAQVSGPVTDTTPAGTATGAIPTLTSMTATIDCAGQTNGSGTAHVKGTLPEGSIDADLTDLRVECDAFNGAKSISAAGIVILGGTKVFVTLTIQPTGATTLFFATAPISRFFNGPPPSSGSINGTSATFDADALEAVTGAAQPGGPSTVHMQGQVTCGSSFGS